MQVALGVLLVVQLLLMALGLRDLLRRSTGELVGGMKWPWALLIVVGNTIGPIIYFAVARKPLPFDTAAGDTSTGSVTDRAQAAAELLYGASDSEADGAGGPR